MRQTSRCAVILGAALLYSATGAAAQQSASADSTPYVKAFQLVNNGEPEEGRALVDSLLKNAKEGTPEYAEGLYWRARLTSIGPAAERDYRRLVVDYATTSRAPDALVRLGQLELARGDRDASALHFRRAVMEYPTSPVYAAANYWLARAYLEGNKIERACIANAEAMAKVKSSDIELKNQIEFQNQQCRGIALKVPGEGEPVTKGKAVATKKGKAVTKAEPADSSETPAEVSDDSSSHEPVKVRAMDSDSEFDPADSTVAPVKPSPKKKDVAAAKVTEKTTVKTTAKAAAKAPDTKGKTAPFAVQVAAYNTREQAVALVASLKEKGYSAHIDGTKAPFRVRIGRFISRVQAEALLVKLRAKQIDGFVTQG